MKIIIIGPKNANKVGLARQLTYDNNNLQIIGRFSSNEKMKNKLTDLFDYYMDINEIKKSFKNNALLFATSTSNYTYGVTYDQFYYGDILILDFIDFNNISNVLVDSKLSNELFVFLDRAQKHSLFDLNESYLAFNKIFSMKHLLYFLDESIEDISKCILDEILKNEE